MTSPAPEVKKLNRKGKRLMLVFGSISVLSLAGLLGFQSYFNRYISSCLDKNAPQYIQDENERARLCE